jgi:uncharacterized alkaline shock family protein YloU
MNNNFKRFLLAAYSLILTILAITLIFASFSPEIFDNISGYISDNILSNQGYKIILIIVEIMFLALSLTFLLSGINDDRDKKSISKFTEIGEIKISLHSLETIALTASKRLSGIKETRAYVNKAADGITVIVRAVVLADVNIPVLSEDIQVKVKKTVEETSGVKVNEVKVIVDNIFSGYSKSRVE